jgi:hypothetical protein
VTGDALRIGYVTIDVPDPLEPAGFWAEALGYEVAATTPYVIVKDPSGRGPHLHVQRAGTSGAPRLHLDLFTNDRAGARRRLEALGATTVASYSENGIEWDVLESPFGERFCLFDEG